jgi:DnaJ-class molecular chaperone
MQTVDPEVKDMMGAIIKQGFRELAKKHHPDADGGDNNMMILVSQAKELLDVLI